MFLLIDKHLLPSISILKFYETEKIYARTK